MPAPFVIAHLQLGLLLQSLGAPLAPAERAGVYLTNALTGWTPAEHPKQHLLFPVLEAERDAADAVKQNRKILVVLGNPPYNGFAGLAVAEERDLTDAYRTGKLTPAGEPDLSVFSTEFNREGIQGTAIALLVRTDTHTGTEEVCFRHFWGKNKRQEYLLKNPG